MNHIKELLVQRFGESVILAEDSASKQYSLTIAKELIAEVCLELRNNPITYFDFLSSISGVDHGPETNRMTVVYHLASLIHKTQLTIKVELERSSDLLPSLPSVSSVWRAADWHEREAYDLLGIRFDGHPDMRRILLPDDWEGYPLRKDYKTAENYKGIKIDY